MIAVDTNILVYAHRQESPWYGAASARVRELAEGRTPWAIPWPCVHEFLSTVTHPRVYAPPTPLAAALDQISVWLEAPSVVLLAESVGYWEYLRANLEPTQVVGPRVHDARIAALCQYHGVTELWTADRDFSRFPGLAVRNPLV